MSSAISCRGLRKVYPGGLEAVRGLDLEIAAGDCFGLLGPNGAGKTTTIEILEGLLAPTAGEVSIFGRNWRQHASEIRQWLGVSLQETRLSEQLTVRETLALFASFYRFPRDLDEVLNSLQLQEKRDTLLGKLSGGQRQRVAVATALVAAPRILFLDEPTTGLDPQSRRQLWQVIREFQQQGGTVLLTTHYLDEAERLADRIAIMDLGRIIAQGTPQQLIDSLHGEHVIEFTVAGQPSGTVDWLSIAGVNRAQQREGNVQLHAAAPHQVLPELLRVLERAGGRLERLSTRQATLEDVFVQLTGRRLHEEGQDEGGPHGDGQEERIEEAAS